MTEMPNIVCSVCGTIGCLTHSVYRIVVEVPLVAGWKTAEHICDAVFDAAHDAEPEDRDCWDIAAYATVGTDDAG